MDTGMGSLLSNKKGKDKKKEVAADKKYLRLWVKTSTEEDLKTISREVAYKSKKDYPYWEIMEDALKLLAKQKKIEL